MAVSNDTEMVDALSFSLSKEESLKDESHDPDKQAPEGKILEEKGQGHKGMVCSRCCVERGTEGEVWCLGCLRAERGD